MVIELGIIGIAIYLAFMPDPYHPIGATKAAFKRWRERRDEADEDEL